MTYWIYELEYKIGEGMAIGENMIMPTTHKVGKIINTYKIENVNYVVILGEDGDVTIELGEDGDVTIEYTKTPCMD